MSRLYLFKTEENNIRDNIEVKERGGDITPMILEILDVRELPHGDEGYRVELKAVRNFKIGKNYDDLDKAYEEAEKHEVDIFIIRVGEVIIITPVHSKGKPDQLRLFEEFKEQLDLNPIEPSAELTREIAEDEVKEERDGFVYKGLFEEVDEFSDNMDHHREFTYEKSPFDTIAIQNYFTRQPQKLARVAELVNNKIEKVEH